MASLSAQAIVSDSKSSGETFLLAIPKWIHSSAVILTTGTFLNGLIHIGLEHFPGGRIGEDACTKLSRNLRKAGFTVNSLKTGTTPRLDGKTIDFSVMKAQKGEKDVIPFSFSTKTLNKHDIPSTNIW